MRAGLHYLITSGMTGYIPNPSEVAISNNWLGPYKIQGNPHINDDSCASYNSQISCVFKHPYKKDLYIAMADRWVPDYVVTKDVYSRISRSIASRFNDKYKATLEERESLAKAPLLSTVNTSVSTYVWLPISFEGEKAIINWAEEWKIEDFS